MRYLIDMLSIVVPISAVGQRMNGRLKVSGWVQASPRSFGEAVHAVTDSDVEATVRGDSRLRLWLEDVRLIRSGKKPKTLPPHLGDVGVLTQAKLVQLWPPRGKAWNGKPPFVMLVPSWRTAVLAAVWFQGLTVCVACGIPFNGRVGQTQCGHACRQESYRRRTL